MPRFYRRSRRAGLSPGTVEQVERKDQRQVRISQFDYSAEKWGSLENVKVDVLSANSEVAVSWINLDGVHETKLLEQIGGQFGIHPLVLEDFVNTDQRPKMEQYDDFVYVVLKMMRYDAARRMVEGEQLSLVLGPRFVISFQERPGTF